MADQFTEVTTKGFGNRIMDSIKGVVAGVLIFFASFGLLFWNEGRVDVSDIAKNATEISADKAADASLDGKLVAASGNLTAEEQIGDEFSLPNGMVTLKNGKYIVVNRNVEMYSWVEEKSSTTEKNVGGSETTKTTYTYKKNWTSNPTPSNEFNQGDKYPNPAMRVSEASNKVSSAKVGIYDLDVSNASLPGSTKLSLSKEKIILPGAVAAVSAITGMNTGVIGNNTVTGTMSPTETTGVTGSTVSGNSTFTGTLTPDSTAPATTSSTATVTGTLAPPGTVLPGATLIGTDYIFVGNNYSTPAIGDLRISYSVVNADQKVTLFGEMNSGSIEPFIGEKNTKLYRVFAGSKDEGVAAMHGEYAMWLWIIRLVGFLMMWIGLCMVVGPISTVLDFLPILGELSRSLIGVVLFVISLVLSIVTIVVSMLLHNLIAMIVAAVITFGVVIFVLSMLKKKKNGGHGGPKPATVPVK